MGLAVMFAVWVVLGLIVGMVAGMIWKGGKPYGEVGDYAIAVVATVLMGLGVWYIVPLVMEGDLIRFIAAVTEPPLMALFVLWLVRKLKK